METEKGKDCHRPEPKLNHGGIAETNNESFNTLISPHNAVAELTKSWSSRRTDSRQHNSKTDQEGLQRGQRPEGKVEMTSRVESTVL